jgi:hypothetical protein
MLALGFLLSGCVPAMAQRRPRHASTVLPILPLVQGGTSVLTALNALSLLPSASTPSVAVSPEKKALPDAPKAVAERLNALAGPSLTGVFGTYSVLERPAEPSILTDETAINPRNERNSVADSQVHYMQTSFSEQVRLPFFRIWRGRVEIGAFDSDQYMDNTLLGPQRAAGLPISSMFEPAHHGRFTPVDDLSYGMMLSLHFEPNSEWGPHIHGWRCLGRVVGSGRGCRLD